MTKRLQDAETSIPTMSGHDSAQIREIFSAIAPSYDFLNHFLSLGMDLRWRRKAVQLLRHDHNRKETKITVQNQMTRGLPDSQTPRLLALDLCGGTGDFAWQLHKRLPEASVVVADFARPMLSRARQKFFPRREISFVECDALNLPYSNGVFRVVTCAFGIRNLENLEQGIDEIGRVMKPNGELLILEFMGGQTGCLYRIFSIYFQQIMPLLGRLISGHRTAYRYLSKSVDRFVTTEQFSDLLKQKGFQLKGVHHFFFGMCTLYYACWKSGGT